MDRVLLIVMPWCGVERPQVGVSTLKAHLLSDGIPCDIAYFNIPFAEGLGYNDYRWVTDNYDYTLFCGDWVFARSLYSNGQLNGEKYVEKILMGRGQLDREKLNLVARMSALVEPFLDYCMRSIDWSRYSLIGFTSTFEQNLSSLALAKRIKQRYPDKILVMGGGNCGGEMGVQIHRSFPFLDYVFTGEADASFPQLVRRLGRGDPRRDDIEGYVRREGGESVETGSARLLQDLDELPYPDFDDYFRQFWASGLAAEVAPLLQIETARGCWWGAKQHCTFCGLNRDEMSFRAKSPERALDEVLHLVNRHSVHFISAVDNIISMHYFRNFLPELARRRLGVKFFYETKANLKKDQVELLHRAGVTEIQPGLESFSDHVLKLMRKGVSPLQNVQLLKWCQELGMRPQWNLLCGFPGENAADYEQVRQYVDALGHLPPAMGWGPLRLDRFSPYYDFPDQYGIRILSALEPYRYLFPIPEPELSKLAYFFEYTFEGKEKVMTWFEPIRQQLEFWKENHQHARLELEEVSPELAVVHDTRPNRYHSSYRFPALEKSILEFCDQIQPFRAITQHVASICNGSSPSQTWLEGFLGYLVDHRLMLRDADRYLSLPLKRQTGPGRAAASAPGQTER